MWFEPATVEVKGARLAVTARLDPASGAGWADRSAFRVTLLHGDEAIEFTGCSGADRDRAPGALSRK